MTALISAPCWAFQEAVLHLLTRSGMMLEHMPAKNFLVVFCS